MLTTSRLTALARVATLSMALAVPLATAAYADDEYGTGHAAVIAQAAASQPAPALGAVEAATLNDVFKVGQNDAFGAARSSQLAPAPQGSLSRLASMSRTISGKVDVVGAGGAQDELATAIYHPGSGTDW